MPGKPQWATLEGGMAQGFPLSINQSVDWLSLRRGECAAQDMVSGERDGVMEYESAPAASSSCFIKDFVAYTTLEGDLASNQINYLTYNGNSFWIEPTEGKNLMYGSLITEINPVTVELSGGAIKLIIEMGDSRILILKEDRGFVFDMDPNELISSTPYFGIGASADLNAPARYTNAVIAGAAVISWSAGAAGQRHWLWDGRGEAVELSRTVRAYASTPAAIVMPTVNWARNLAIFGSLVYDLERKRVLYFSGATTAALTTRPYYHVQFHPLVVSKLAFYCNGKSGSFKCAIEYGQAQDNLAKTKEFTVTITDQTKNRFRHIWTIENPIRCRVYRLVVTALTGIGLTQVDSLTVIDDGPDGYDGDA